MDWSHETCLRVISEYRKREVLWNPRDSSYYNKTTKDNVWRDLAERCGKSSEEVKKKLDSLKGSYRREKARVKKSCRTGKGRKEIYESKWFAYESLQFLDEKDAPYKPLSNVQNTSDETPPREHLDSESLDDSNDQGSRHENDKIVDEAKNSEASDVEKASTDTEKPKLKSVRKRLVKRKKSHENPIRTAEAVGHIQPSITGSNQSKDECSLFGDYIADKLRKFDNRSRAVAQHKISNILFKLEMSKTAS